MLVLVLGLVLEGRGGAGVMGLGGGWILSTKSVDLASVVFLGGVLGS